MNVWRVLHRLATLAAILLIAVLAMPSAALAHAGHGPHAGALHAPEPTQIEIAAEVAMAPVDGDTRRGDPHGSCAGPCCNVACSPACASHALSNAASAPSPDADVLARLGSPREALPTDPPERRLPKPPRG